MITKTLSTKVRVLTTQQLALHFYQDMKNPAECAYRAARKLQREGFAKTWPAMITHLEIDEPLLTWAPGDDQPEFGKLAWQNQKRWTKNAPAKTICLTSTDKANAQFGGSCREPRPLEIEHDVNVAQVYLTLKQLSPEVAGTWKHEDSLSHTNSKRPDAMTEMQGQQIVIDLLGRGYSRKKIQALWKHHKQLRLELR